MTERKPPGTHKKAGRPKGAKTRRAVIISDKRAAHIIESGVSPLDVLMSSLRFWNREVAKLETQIEEKLPPGESVLRLERTGPVASYFEGREKLQDAAKDAAPYVHPRMASMDSPGGGLKDLSRLTDEELDALERITRKISVSYGDAGGNTKA